MKEELKKERKELTDKWDALEKQLIELASKNEKMIDVFLDWQEVRTKLNENFFKIIEACSPTNQEKQSFEYLFERHKEFAIKRFPDSTAESSLKGLEREIQEIREEPNRYKKGIEYIDSFFYLLDSFNREGYSFDEMKLFMIEKLIINENRDWNKNEDNSYSHKK